MGVFAASGQARTFDFMAGDVGYVPLAALHKEKFPVVPG
jgi:oxalate decarboxylase